MLKSYRSYLEYKELRRRIEAKLSKPRNVLIHAIVFLVANIALWYIGFSQINDSVTAANTIFPGLFTSIWSFALLAHALWGFYHSGMWPSIREAAVEAEMGDVLDSAASNMSENDFFEIHRMLHEDIRQRAGYMFSLTMFAFSNSFVWVLWLLKAGNWYINPLWYPVVFAAFVFLLGGGILNFWRTGIREQKRMQTNTLLSREKQQTHESRYFATPEHGRLEIVDDDSPLFEKRKR